MLTGPKRKRRISWGHYRSPSFMPNLKDDGNWSGCGTAALSMLTGLRSRTVERGRRRKSLLNGWSCRKMCEFLRARGYTVVPVTKWEVITNWVYKGLHPEHVLLLHVMADTDCDTWMILHQNVLYHNFKVEKDFDSMYFLNYPTNYVYIVWHPKWAKQKDWEVTL